MVLAIECDGASYHSSETARDRDRLRQEQLERLGWTFHRIWSQDWFRDKQRETDRAVAAYTMAVAAADGDHEQASTPTGAVQDTLATSCDRDAAARPAPAGAAIPDDHGLQPG